MANNVTDESTILNEEDDEKIKALQDKWEQATTQDDKDRIHAEAELIRAAYGYSGGGDGSAVNALTLDQYNQYYDTTNIADGDRNYDNYLANVGLAGFAMPATTTAGTTTPATVTWVEKEPRVYLDGTTGQSKNGYVGSDGHVYEDQACTKPISDYSMVMTNDGLYTKTPYGSVKTTTFDKMQALQQMSDTATYGQPIFDSYGNVIGTDTHDGNYYGPQDKYGDGTPGTITQSIYDYVMYGTSLPSNPNAHNDPSIYISDFLAKTAAAGYDPFPTGTIDVTPTGTTGATGGTSGATGSAGGTVGTSGTTGTGTAATGTTGSTPTAYSAGGLTQGTGTGSYAATGSGAGYSGGVDRSAESFINGIYEAKTNSATAALKSAYDQSVLAGNSARNAIPGTYYDARNQTAAQSAIERQNFNEYAAASGLNNGAGGQAQLAMGNTLQANLSSLDKQQAKDISAVDLQLAQIKAKYEGDIAAAIAEGKLQEAQALYQQYQIDQQNAIQQAQFDAQMNANKSNSNYAQMLNKAQTLAAAGDFSGYKALGYTAEEIASLQTSYLVSNSNVTFDNQRLMIYRHAQTLKNQGLSDNDIRSRLQEYVTRGVISQAELQSLVSMLQ
jgi:hypothetical protein